ncbi:hypothetical protein [Oceanobacillus sp. J11TS1]|uniref:hypothetical protein n=1 Tax=Oceanobacillus sp. J11TS1 TaxID=2807191 RepID=UPI001B264FCA|nr:hypothetical protein [Oceanobacillus sp. J11TS1]GIO25099.1 hypothetical protein J11TS1_36800 [Oceanobacillus sp. J11TS1]
MITNESIKAYIDKMPGNDDFLALVEEEQDKIIFSSHELLKDHYKERDITDRAVALQVLYSIEGEDEEYAKLKRHGIKSYSVKGVSVTFEGGEIAPSVIAILGEPRTKSAKVGRLI